ncbi:hypothetical protein [Nocardioides xinjiangensis]|uniref:hypothetical protein n=1 Tax=Nocardioides xinjiangensis TaxID=2817376 RepID=UPI001B311296|nr:MULTISPECIES: hypothetical protein [unclassified Nocardioides]
MSSRHGARLAALLALAALLLPAASHAGTMVTEDATGDSRAWTDYEKFQFVPAPEEASVDVLRTAAAFVPRRLTVTVHFRDLEVRMQHRTLVRVWTPRGTFDVPAERRFARRVTVALARQRGEAFGCRGASAMYGGAADTVALSVPARCIGAPRWVRLGVRATATPRLYADDPGTVFFLADDGHRDGYRVNSLAKGPRIRRG